jgi:hypothetical protein
MVPPRIVPLETERGIGDNTIKCHVSSEEIQENLQMPGSNNVGDANGC